MNVFLYVGTVQAVGFSIVNVASSSQPCKITIEVDCTVAGTIVSLVANTALLSMERTNTSIRFATPSSTNTFSNSDLSNSLDIYVSQSASQTSNFTPISYTIEQL